MQILFARRFRSKVILITILTMLVQVLWGRGNLRLSDSAYFGGDTWEYQSMAVNLLYGHGIQRFGEMEDFTKYKFDASRENIRLAFANNAGEFNSLRTPGYGVFMAVVYSIFGVSPSALKFAQLFLLSMAASIFIPIAYGMKLPNAGIVGISTSLVSFAASYRLADTVLAESLAMFFVSLIILFTFRYTKYQRYGDLIGLGIICGIGMLVKPIVLFLVLSSTVLLLRIRGFRVSFPLFLLSIGVAVLPWSVKASFEEKALVLLSTQAPSVLYAYNNGGSAGYWNPQFEADYPSETSGNSQEISKRPLVRVLNFYLSDINRGVKLILAKLAATFLTLPPFFLILLLLFLSTNRLVLGEGIRLPLEILMIMVATFWVCLLVPPLSSFSIYFYRIFVAPDFSWILGLLVFLAFVFLHLAPSRRILGAESFALLWAILLVALVSGADPGVYPNRFSKIFEGGLWLTVFKCFLSRVRVSRIGCVPAETASSTHCLS